jgi:hypothetical protein
MKRKKAQAMTVKNMLYSCGILFSTLSMLYMYFVSASVLHVVIREELKKEGEQLRSEIGNLETNFITEQHKVNEAVVLQHGFKKTGEKIFIDRTPDSFVLLTRNE